MKKLSTYKKICIFIALLVVSFIVFDLKYDPSVKLNDDLGSSTMFITPVDMDPLEFALSFYGTKEKLPNGQSNPVVLSMYDRFSGNWKVTNSNVAWCSAFMCSVYSSCGYEYSGKLNARSWQDVGVEVSEDEVSPGDLVVFWRESPESWKGHIAMYISHDDNYIHVLGGNQSNQVNISAYSKKRKLCYIRPRRLEDIYRDRFPNAYYEKQDTIVINFKAA